MSNYSLYLNAVGNSKTKSIIAYSLILISVVVFFCLKKGYLFGAEIDLDLAQATVYPIVVVAVFFITCKHCFLSKAIVLSSALIGVIATSFAFTVWSNGKDAAHIAKFIGDRYETKTKIYRESLNEELKNKSTVKFYRYWDQVADREDVKTVFKNEPNVKMLLWGDDRNLHLDFRIDSESSLAQFAKNFGNINFENTNIIWQVPHVNIAFQPYTETQELIGSLSAGYLLYAKFINSKNSASDNTISNYEFNLIEKNLKKAATKAVRWKIAEPIGLSWWLLGNFYLRMGLVDQASSKGYWACADLAYRKAASFVFSKYNPELYIAIHNNHAMLQILRLNNHKDKSIYRNARKTLRKILLAKGYFPKQQVKNNIIKMTAKNLKLLKAKRKSKFTKKKKRNNVRRNSKLPK